MSVGSEADLDHAHMTTHCIMANSHSEQMLALLRSICKRDPRLRPPRSFRNAIDVGCKSADERLD